MSERPGGGYTSRRAAELAPSLIRAVAEAGFGQPGVIPLWFGEGCWPTSDIAVEAARRALRDGDHFYQANSGKPELRGEISDYYRRIYGIEVDPRRVTVTASGMQGIALAAQALVDAGDRAVVVGPVWPNVREALRISGAAVVDHSLRSVGDRWSLDVARLIDDIGDDARLVYLNSPNNPTGWTMSTEDLDAVREHGRRHRVWIVADDVYSRLHHGHVHAPGALMRAEPDDLVISVNSFSKAWSMTGGASGGSSRRQASRPPSRCSPSTTSPARPGSSKPPAPPCSKTANPTSSDCSNGSYPCGRWSAGTSPTSRASATSSPTAPSTASSPSTA